jgi:hypothetical protein
MAKLAFVLGAGASVDFGLPTGAELLNEVAALARMRTSSHASAQNITLTPEGFRDCIFSRCGDRYRALCAAGADLSSQREYSDSIDDLLHKLGANEAVVEIGKLAIVTAILDREARSNLAKLKEGGGDENSVVLSNLRNKWLFRLCNHLLSAVRFEKVHEVLSDIYFVNFNYDRCLEQFLYFYIQQSYHVTSRQAADALASLTVARPYGVIGQLPWQSAGPEIMPYGTRPLDAPIDKLHGNIRTLNDQNHDTDTLADLRRQLHAAGRIVFLGFGFHPQNMDLLGSNRQYGPGPRSDQRLLHASIFATAHGIHPANQQALEQRLKGQFDTAYVTIADCLCEGLIETYPWRGS